MLDFASLLLIRFAFEHFRHFPFDAFLVWKIAKPSTLPNHLFEFMVVFWILLLAKLKVAVRNLPWIVNESDCIGTEEMIQAIQFDVSQKLKKILK